MNRTHAKALTLLLFVIAACASSPPTTDWTVVRNELTRRVGEDQRLRRELQSDGSLDMQAIERLGAVDEDNTAWMKALIQRSGWPTIEQVGDKGASDAWLLVQHADHDVDFQEHCLCALREAVARAQASPKNLAYLEDRVALHRGRPQRYGTQFVSGSNGLEPHTLEDPARVDEWRAAVGLGPLADYAARLKGAPR